MTDNVIIIGAGQAGLQVATTLRQKGYSGQILLIGEESAPPYERPPLSKRFLQGGVPEERLTLKQVAWYQDKAIECLTGHAVTKIDRKQKRVFLSDNTDHPYDRLVLATGSRVRKLDIPGSELPGVHYLRNIADARAIRRALKPGKKLVIVGGGYIGLEVASAARSMNCDVTILEAADRVMQRVAATPVSDFFQREHMANSVDVRLNTGITRINGDDRVTEVICSDGTARPADLVVIGIGVIPNQELAADTGLKTGNGILVDEFAVTSDPDIFAAGDCTCHPNAYAGGRVRLESVQNAVDQGKCAALSILGMPKAYREIPWFWSDQYDLKLQIAGLWDPEDQVIVRGDPDQRKFSVLYLRNDALAAINTVNNLQDFLPAKKLIAAGTLLDAEKAGDPEISLKSFLQTV